MTKTSPSIFDRIRAWLSPGRSQAPVPPAGPAPAPPPVSPQSLPPPVTPKVSLLIFDPILPSQSGRRLQQVMGWNNPDTLVQQYIQDVAQISYGYARYEIAERIVIADFPVKQDGFTYTPDQYLQAMRAGGFHQPDQVNYNAILAAHHLVEKVNQGAIDEVWLMGFPYAGFFESRMAGPGAFWCNAPPLEHTGAKRRFVIMGFNDQRGVGEMLEDLGHRTEAILERVFRSVPDSQNLWKRFTRHDQTNPGLSEVGSIHFAPNSRKDYDWGNPSAVLSRANTWLNYPNLSGSPHRLTSAEWGGGDIRAHHKWWFRHLPHVTGETNGIANNWWRYVIDPNTVP